MTMSNPHMSGEAAEIARGRIRRVEKDPEGGWIARARDGSIYYDNDWRWNSRSVARDVVRELDWIAVRQELERG